MSKILSLTGDKVLPTQKINNKRVNNFYIAYVSDDPSSGDGFNIDLSGATGNVTINLSNPVKFSSIILRFQQGLTPRSIVSWNGGVAGRGHRRGGQDDPLGRHGPILPRSLLKNEGR